MKRAPQSLADDIKAIPGVSVVETRVVADVTLDVEGLQEPAIGRLISITVPGGPLLNQLFVRRGRLPEPNRPDEVVLNEAFALAHQLAPGARLRAVINGRRRDLRIVGLALSPEYTYTIRPGDIIPDNLRFGIVWMERTALGAAFDMEGGFNDVTLTLAPDAVAPAVQAATCSCRTGR
jgi:putative ABC transport system permease protein